ncbi:hypothetical protein ACFL7D_02955 [candidate division KSB1 bacterium]
MEKTCPFCNSPVDDSAKQCPECQFKFTSGEAEEKEEKKDFTHYQIILLDPGPRENTVEILSEISGLSEKKIRKNLSSLPWTVVTHIPLNKATEYKILLETNKAKIKLEGVDIWAEEKEEIVVKEKKEPRYFLTKRNLRILEFSIIMVLLAAVIYILINVTGTGESGDIRIIEYQIDPSAAGKTGEGKYPGALLIPTEPAHTEENFNIRIFSFSPYNRSIKMNLEILKEVNIDLKVIDFSGGTIASLVKGNMESNNYMITWNGRKDDNTTARTGEYFLKLTAGSKTYFFRIVWFTG